VGWSWSDQPTAAAHEISYNRIHHVVQLLADGASIYTLGRQPGTVIRGNVLYDNLRGPFARQYWQLGLYLDEGSSEILVEHNLSYRVGTHGFNMNGGAECIIRNNIFGPVYGNDAPFVRCHNKPYAKSNLFTQNLCYGDSPNLADAAWPTTLLECRDNLYWNTAGLPLMFAGKPFTEWQASGQDAGSQHADPLFRDPDRGDFTLRPNSPALALGFKPIDPRVAGLTAEYRDVAVPATVTTPPVYAMPQAVLPEDQPGFAIDCEEIPVGVVPREFSARTADGQPGDAQITDTTALSGQRCLQLTDHQGLAKSFLPYLTHRLLRPVTAGQVTFHAAVRQQPGSPCPVSFEFRDYQPADRKREFAGGPAIVVGADGQVTSGGQTVGQIPAGTWATVAVTYTVGDPMAREAAVTLTLPHATPRQVRVTMPADYQTVSQLLIVCGGDVDGTCYVDDLELQVDEHR